MGPRKACKPELTYNIHASALEISSVRFYQCKSCSLNILYAIFVVIMFQKSNFFFAYFQV